MNRKKPLVAELLNVRQTYRGLSPLQRYFFIALFAVEADSYIEVLVHNSVPYGTYGVLQYIYHSTGNPLLAIGLDLIFTIAYLYLAFWFLKKGSDKMDFLAYLLFAVTLISPDLHQSIFGV